MKDLFVIKKNCENYIKTLFIINRWTYTDATESVNKFWGRNYKYTMQKNVWVDVTT